MLRYSYKIETVTIDLSILSLYTGSKNRKKTILFIGIIILIALCIVYKLYKDNKELEIKKLKTALSSEYPIIFSANYEKKYIFVYNRETGERKYVARPKMCDSYLLDLKFSHDNRYIFYTVCEVDFFSSDLIYNFYVVDTESKTKLHLKRWENYEDFFGFEW